MKFIFFLCPVFLIIFRVSTSETTTTANEDEQGNALDETTNADETANADETGTSDETANTDEGRRKRNIPQTTTLVRNKLK